MRIAPVRRLHAALQCENGCLRHGLPEAAVPSGTAHVAASQEKTGASVHRLCAPLQHAVDDGRHHAKQQVGQ